MHWETKLAASLPLFVGACAAVPLAELRETPQPQCTLISFPPNDRIAAWSVDKFTGRYNHAADNLVVQREEHRLFVKGWTLGTRELRADSVESWTWHDGCGVRYEFTLPPDGPGGWLKIVMPHGPVTDWHR